MKASKLKMNKLKRIWLMCDTEKTMSLNEQQFIVCLHLMECAKKGLELPEKLPSDLSNFIKLGTYKNTSDDTNSGQNSYQVKQHEIDSIKDTQLIQEFKNIQQQADLLSVGVSQKISAMKALNDESLQKVQSELDAINKISRELKAIYPQLLSENEQLTKEYEKFKNIKTQGRENLTEIISKVCTESVEVIRSSIKKEEELTLKVDSLQVDLNALSGEKAQKETEIRNLNMEVGLLRQREVERNFQDQQQKEAQQKAQQEAAKEEVQAPEEKQEIAKEEKKEENEDEDDDFFGEDEEELKPTEIQDNKESSKISNDPKEAKGEPIPEDPKDEEEAGEGAKEEEDDDFFGDDDEEKKEDNKKEEEEEEPKKVEEEEVKVEDEQEKVTAEEPKEKEEEEDEDEGFFDDEEETKEDA